MSPECTKPARKLVLTKILKMRNMYGVIDSTGAHVDVSKTEKGAKNYASQNGYKKVSVRYNSGYNAEIIAVKNPKGKWTKQVN